MKTRAIQPYAPPQHTPSLQTDPLLLSLASTLIPQLNIPCPPELTVLSPCDVHLFDLTFAPDHPRALHAQTALDAILQCFAQPQFVDHRAALLIAAPDQHNPHLTTAMLSYDDALYHLFLSLSRLARTADRLACDIWFETPATSLLLSPLETRRLIDEINNPRCRLVLNHSHVAQFTAPNDWLAILGRHIAAVKLPPTLTDLPPALQHTCSLPNPPLLLSE